MAFYFANLKSSIKLPFHILNKQKYPGTAATSTPPAKTTAPVSQPPAQSATPTGFKAFTFSDSGISLSYPATWGSPVTEPSLIDGYTKRGGSNKPDATYAFVIDFTTNKDVEVTLTSSKVLPAANNTAYYTFIQWCTGTNDGKFYKQTLHFTSAAGVDTPSTITCDQGPLTDASKLDDTTIVQLKTKSTAGTVIGDLYTKNLTKEGYPVLRVKDATMKNGEDIKKLLATIKVGNSSSSTSTTH
jgi:hypothetical protein